MRLPTVASGGLKVLSPESPESPETPPPGSYAYRSRIGALVHFSVGINHRLCDEVHDRPRVYVVTTEFPEGRTMCPKCLQLDRDIDRQMLRYGS